MILLSLTCLAGAAELLALDAGSLRSYEMEGFQGLHQEGTDDPRVSWASPPNNARWYRGPDPLTSDDLTGGTLHLDLEPGPWVFWFMLGRVDGTGATFVVEPIGETIGVAIDGQMVLEEVVPSGLDYLKSRFYSPNPFPIFVEGETSWDRQIAPRHRWQEVEVQVPAGEIEVEVIGVPLQGLIAAPAARRAEGEVLAETTDLLRKEWFLTYDRPYDRTSVPLAPKSGPAGVHIGRWLDLPDHSLARTDAKLDIAGAPGERISRILWLFPGDAAANWSSSGLDVPVSGREVHWLDGARALTSDPSTTAPLILRPSDGELHGEQGVPVGLAVTFAIPDDAEPGSSRGTIRFERGDETLEVAVSLRIRDLELLPPAVPVGMFADLPTELVEATGNGSPEVLRVMDEHIALMRERDLDIVAIRYASPWPDRWAPGEEPDTTMFRTFAEHWHAAGGGTIAWWDPYGLLKRYQHDRSTPLSEAWLQTFVGLSRALADVGDSMTYIYDEEGYRGVESARLVPELVERIRALHPEAGPLVGGVTHPADVLAAPHFDEAALHGYIAPRFADILRDQGVRPRGYNFGHGRPGPGLFGWAVGVDSVMQWHWNNAQGDPFNHVSGRRGHHAAILGPDGHVWMTIQGETWAEGVTDQRYLSTLEHLVETLEGSKRKRRREKAARGRALIDALRAAAADARPVGVHENEAWSEEALDAMREQVAREAEHLQQFVKSR